jgi:hypothetical protein
MKPAERVNDALRRGLGRVGRASGAWCNVYRPRGKSAALAPANRVLRMQAAFGPPGEGWRTPSYGGALWWGYFDAAYTQAGDYILREETKPGARDGGIWFIAAQEPMLPLLCVRATRMIDIARPAGATQQGVNNYGGIAKTYSTPLLTQWPAAIMAAGTTGTTSDSLPSDISGGSWSILLPAHHATTLRTGDIVTDDLGRTAILATTELTQLGWRALARQATT